DPEVADGADELGGADELDEPEPDGRDDAASSEVEGASPQASGGTSHDGVDDDWNVSDSPDDSGFQFVEDAEEGDGKPYLTALPSAYVADLVVMEWLEYLVDESSPTDAARAIRYYENVDWISETVEEKLLDFLVGFGEIDEGTAVLPGTEELTRTHHTRSLSYINRLDGADAESLVVDRWNEIGGPDGL
ncbi:FlaD/FlaE family flagellar protein, partial [Halobium palmae]